MFVSYHTKPSFLKRLQRREGTLTLLWCGALNEDGWIHQNDWKMNRRLWKRLLFM